MHDRDRLWATVVVWTALTVILMAITAALAIVGRDIPLEGLAMVAVIVLSLVGAAGYSTSRIWGGAGQMMTGDPSVAGRAGKAKRRESGRVADLIEELDADEIVELETLLTARDDEQVYPQR